MNQRKGGRWEGGGKKMGRLREGVRRGGGGRG